jgi:polyhydroxyalkanoate synthesis repressor PhaR
MQPQTKVIKRYSNRKLYDTERSCYVTLEEIAHMVKEGVEVKIVDNKTKEDLTSVTLTQIIFAEEKKQKSILPLSTLREIIRSGGESLQEFFHKNIAEPITQVASKKPMDFFRKSDVDANPSSASASPPNAGGSDGEPKDRGAFREWFDAQRAAIDEWQRRIDENVKESFGSFALLPKIHIELERLRARLDELESRIEQIERTKSP